jgi:hypothetical protein
MAIDFEKEFDNFVTATNSSAIKDIYSIIPSLSQEQQEILLSLEYFIEKYKIAPLRKFIDNYLLNMKQNKNLGFLSSMNMKSLLKAYTADDMLRGVKANVSHALEDK